jgi:hypothetical protein
MPAHGLRLHGSVVKYIFGISELIEPSEASGAAAGPARGATGRAAQRRERQGNRTSAKIPAGTRDTSPGTGAPLSQALGRWSWRPVAPLTRRDPTESDLLWLEEEIGASLPEDYRLFLRSHGWCRCSEAMGFPMGEPAPWGDRAQISAFLGFSTETQRDLAFLVSEAFADSLPEGTIPIAADEHGNLLLLGIAGAATERVWFWDRECRGLDGMIDDMVDDLEAEGQEVVDDDEDQILRRWEAMFPERRTRPLGFTNVYAVADSFAAFLESLRGDARR